MRRLLSLAAFALALLASPAWAADATHGVQRVDTTIGTGAVARAGDTVSVTYTGWLYDAAAPDHHGKLFDSSADAGEPIRFVLGAGQVIDGWDQGIAGMRVGGKRTLVIPAALAYGEEGAGDDIPPGATLVFEVELVGVR